MDHKSLCVKPLKMHVQKQAQICWKLLLTVRGLPPQLHLLAIKNNPITSHEVLSNYIHILLKIHVARLDHRQTIDTPSIPQRHHNCWLLNNELMSTFHRQINTRNSQVFQASTCKVTIFERNPWILHQSSIIGLRIKQFRKNCVSWVSQEGK
uniref:Uncharacterized protein n=1 Tax=Opuntia streptacantha TaxID=393608 RepID=A0A7C9DZ74_OPUST